MGTLRVSMIHLDVFLNQIFWIITQLSSFFWPADTAFLLFWGRVIILERFSVSSVLMERKIKGKT